MPSFARDAIRDLEQLRRSRVIVYFGEDRAPFPKGLEDEDVAALYSCLRQLGPAERLALVLHTYGGRVNVSRRIYHLLRTYAAQIDVLVPYKARSAGTLLCLGAHDLVLTSLAELGPIDPYIQAAGETASAMPPVISAEDVRAFRQMAESWFGLQRPEERMQVFKLLAERIFPTTLSSFFRADQQVRQIAAELLGYQLPNASPETRARIVDQLVSGYHAHDYTITRAEVVALGLRVSPATAAEETLLETIWETCRQQLDTSVAVDDAPPERIDGLILSTELTARHVAQMTLYRSASSSERGDRPSTTTHIVHGHWQIG